MFRRSFGDFFAHAPSRFSDIFVHVPSRFGDFFAFVPSIYCFDFPFLLFTFFLVIDLCKVSPLFLPTFIMVSRLLIGDNSYF